MDPERNVKRLRKLFGVSRTILKRAARRPSLSDQESEEQQRKRFQLLREMRQQRISSLGANQRLVERYFEKWLRQIQGILVEGKQIQRDPPDVGPLHMLVNWRQMLAKLTSITEFVTSRAFNNHKDCLTLSRSSKLLNRWDKIDNQVTLALNEAKDNVRFISSLQKFWDPLYRSSPDDIISSLPGLMVAIRNVCKTAHYFNTSRKFVLKYKRLKYFSD
ncbi:hypothetical protein ACLKA7_000887 [Drosophila subpalustris]